MTTLREDFSGFTFESNRGTKHSFSAETSMGAEFSTSWIPGKKTKRLRSKAEAQKLKVCLENAARFIIICWCIVLYCLLIDIYNYRSNRWRLKFMINTSR